MLNKINRSLLRTASVVLLVFSLACSSKPTEDPNHRSFASAQEAVDALVATLEAQDPSELARLLGPGSEDIIDWGDPVEAKLDRARFLKLYRTQARLVPEFEGVMILEIGEQHWPLPVPIVQRDGRWYLDGAEGVEELVYRNVGRNELGAIQVCKGFVDAQYQYASEGHDGLPAGVYATYLISDEGLHNGLYWPSEEGEPLSPAGPFVAAAAAEGYRRAAAGEPSPYHGYFYRMLYRQGEHAPGGAKEYFDDGLLVDGFALIAWPAEYGAGGIKTFMVNQDGKVYEKDLGAETASLVEAIRVFDPDRSWNEVQAP